MATIFRPKKKDNRNNRNKTDIVIKTHKLVYDQPYWKQLRLSYLMEHPICEYCNKNLATEVHHIRELSKATSDNEMISLGFDVNNLMAVCTKCHQEIHSHK